jgi:hypothetical protein
MCFLSGAVVSRICIGNSGHLRIVALAVIARYFPLDFGKVTVKPL